MVWEEKGEPSLKATGERLRKVHRSQQWSLITRKGKTHVGLPWEKVLFCLLGTAEAAIVCPLLGSLVREGCWTERKSIGELPRQSEVPGLWGGVVDGSIQVLESKHSKARFFWIAKDGKAKDKPQIGKFRVSFLG